MAAAPDWAAWSRETVSLMQARNAALLERFGLEKRAYQWSMDDAKLVFPSTSAGRDAVEADVCVIGSVSISDGTFLWAWANESIPATARKGLERVRLFGEENDLGLLTDSEWRGGRAEGLEMAAIAGRLLDADAVWVDVSGDVTLFFALSNVRRGSDRGTDQ